MVVGNAYVYLVIRLGGLRTFAFGRCDERESCGAVGASEAAENLQEPTGGRLHIINRRCTYYLVGKMHYSTCSSYTVLLYS